MAGRRVAAIVTVSKYSDETINDLIGSHRDGSELCYILRDIGFEAEHLHELDDDKVVDAIEDSVSGLSAGDTFLFYFAGHGMTPMGGSEHLLLGPDARLRHIERGYPRNSIRLSFIDDLLTVPGLDRIFILDACRTQLRSGRGGRAELSSEEHLRDIGTRQKSPAGSYAVLNSCSKSQQACELPGMKQGLFTAALIDVLRKYHHTGRKLYADGRLRDELAERMDELARSEGLSGQQDPAFRAGGRERVLLVDGESNISGDMSGHSRIHVLSSRVFFESSPVQGAEVYINGENVGTTPFSAILESGTYAIRSVHDEYGEWESEIEFSAGDGSQRLVCNLQRNGGDSLQDGIPHASSDSEGNLWLPPEVYDPNVVFSDSESSWGDDSPLCDLIADTYHEPPDFPQAERKFCGRFRPSEADGTISDTITGLEWLVGPDEGVSHYEAERWACELGGLWRLPTVAELRELYEEGIRWGAWGLFECSGRLVWSGEVHETDSSKARAFAFNLGCVFWSRRDIRSSSTAFAVRSGRT